MLRFWNNPELIRHRRSELRPARAITAGAVIVVLCLLLGLACWSYEQSMMTRSGMGSEYMADGFAQRAWLLFYRWLVGLQGLVVTFWAMFSCAQSVSGERDRKTWDFQRTTGLTATEIVIGKLLGEPILVYFAIACAAPITIVAGLAGGISIVTVLSVYVCLAITSAFLGLGGMWLSMLLESRTRGVGLISAFALYGITVALCGMYGTGLPGLAALSPLTTLVHLLANGTDAELGQPLLFGNEVPWLLMTLLLCGSFGAWFAVMLIRNLKRDYAEIRPLSRWQAVGCAAFLNFLIYALLRPASSLEIERATPGWFADAKSVALFAVAINGLILFLMGLATLTPQERLKVWRRKRTAGQSALFADDGLPWPWLGISAVVAYALLVWGLLAWNHSLPIDMATLQSAAIRLLLVLVFVMRDVLFLQWCMLTRLRQPIVKGVLFIGLYYATAGVLIALAGVSSEASARWMTSVLTPVMVFDPDVKGLAFPAATYGGLILQLVLISIVLIAVDQRLKRPLQSPTAA
jgi:hypothetical protein